MPDLPLPPADAPTEPVSTPMTDKAMARLRRLASGNGMDSNKISLTDTIEQIYILEGRMQLTPRLDPEPQVYPGQPRNKKARMFPDMEHLQQATTEKQTQFCDGTAWLETAVKEISEAPGQGWGMEELTITLPNFTEIFATTETCGMCQGQAAIVCEQCLGQQRFPCPQCQGQGRELCPQCMGRARDMANPSKNCAFCQGSGMIVCRPCQGNQTIACPRCDGKGQTPCDNCRATGRIAHEIRLSALAVGSFRLVKTPLLPSGFLQAIDRLGMPNLPKGHGKVTFEAPKPDPSDPTAKTSIVYKAEVPFAEMKIKFGETGSALVSCFGIKGVLLGCPPFLDLPLKKGIAALRAAAEGRASLDKATKYRAINETILLELEGKGGDTQNGQRNLKQLYPVGLSLPVSREILRYAEQALISKTRMARIAAAFAFFLVGVGLDIAYFMTSLAWMVYIRFSDRASNLVSLLPLLLSAGLAWMGLGAAAKLALQKEFPNKTINKTPKLGHTGLFLFIMLVVAYLAITKFAQFKPPWASRFWG